MQPDWSAGASQLPSGWSFGQSAAQTEFAANKQSGDTAAYANVTVNSSNDSVRVTVSRTNPSFFANLFGITSANISASATATVLAYSKVVSTGQVMPWGVMKNSWTLGSSYSLYVDNSTPNNGALSLNAKGGSACQSTSGAADYKNEIIGPPNGSVVCDVSVGDVLPVKTGQNTGPTSQGIDTRITSWDPISAIVQFTANGQANSSFNRPADTSFRPPGTASLRSTNRRPSYCSRGPWPTACPTGSTAAASRCGSSTSTIPRTMTSSLSTNSRWS